MKVGKEGGKERGREGGRERGREGERERGRKWRKEKMVEEEGVVEEMEVVRRRELTLSPFLSPLSSCVSKCWCLVV